MAICSSGDVLGYCIEQMVMPLLLEAANITELHIVSALSGDEFLPHKRAIQPLIHSWRREQSDEVLFSHGATKLE